MKITVVNKHHGASGEYIGRGSPLGNPYRVTKALPQEEAIARFREYLANALRDGDTGIYDELNRLYHIAQACPLNLVCFCAPKPCHGDVIREILLEAHKKETNQ